LREKRKGQVEVHTIKPLPPTVIPPGRSPEVNLQGGEEQFGFKVEGGGDCNRGEERRVPKCTSGNGWRSRYGQRKTSGVLFGGPKPQGKKRTPVKKPPVARGTV